MRGRGVTSCAAFRGRTSSHGILLARKPVHADAELLPVSTRSAATPSCAGAWFLTCLRERSRDEIGKKYLSHTDEDRWFRMTILALGDGRDAGQPRRAARRAVLRAHGRGRGHDGSALQTVDRRRARRDPPDFTCTTSRRSSPGTSRSQQAQRRREARPEAGEEGEADRTESETQRAASPK